MNFPGATATRDGADYVLVGAPLDVSTTFQPGARFGPDRIRRFVESYEDYDHRTASHFTDLHVHDHGNIRAWGNADEYLEYLEGVLCDIRDDEAMPLVLGGEHTVSIAGVRAVEPEIVVSLDAHLDLRQAFHGNELNHACAMARALEVADELYVVGARTGGEDEWQRAREDDVTVISPEEVSDWEVPSFDGSVYLTVDVDAADPSVAPGTGTMEPFGLSARQLRDVVREVAPQAAGADVVEVNDRDDGQAAALAGKLLREIVFSHAAGRR